ncbi:glycosyltransferase family 2 protein [Frigidibacter sp. RF13]|uniref:glycosyltransferase family 2 protein n=1 Tax=Frigidibacter sp. RF13 TaxID=2997340 RepID=UPI002270CCFC|nr:glycosyltransferase family 2 protein [Frigidibacter sp. RF13]MCY1128189.1 glycosyltransferase family 2 protein [Frigidibacter sp. RF13]
MPEPCRTTIVSVCHNSLAVLPAMLASVPVGMPVVLVDNASADPEGVERYASPVGARVIRNPDNRGFGVACNIGASEANTEFVMFLNPDAALEPGCIAAVEEAMDRFPRASALNPRILEADGRPYFKRRSVLLPRRERMPRGWPEADREVTVLSGAALMVRRADFEAVGGFDPKIFLYHEDDDLSLRLRAERGPLMFIRSAAVRHAGGGSSPRSAEMAAFKAWHMGRSRVYAARKHGLRWGGITAAMAGVAQMALPWNFLSRRQIHKRFGFVRGIFSGYLGADKNVQ